MKRSIFSSRLAAVAVVALSAAMLAGSAFAQITSYPYTENFDTGAGGWTVTGTSTSWALGAPNSGPITTADSGTDAWVTGLTANYADGEDGSVVSPVFDFSSFTTDPVLSLAVYRASEGDWDGAWVEMTTNGGTTWTKLGTAADPNWYNNATDQWWDDPNNGGAPGIGWESMLHSLTGAAGLSAVQIRVRFTSDGIFNFPGIAFDSVFVGDIALMNVTRGGNGVTSGGNDNVGIGTIGSPTNLAYTIESNGSAALTLSGTPAVATSNLVNCSVNVTQPASTSIAGGANEGFQIDVTPTAAGAFSVDVSIANNSVNASPYTYSLSGTALPPQIFFDGFESGAISSSATEQTTGTFQATTTNTSTAMGTPTTYATAANTTVTAGPWGAVSSPNSGTNFWGLDFPGGDSAGALSYSFDLSAYDASTDTVQLAFSWAHSGEEDDVEDNVFISVDGGTTWLRSIHNFDWTSSPNGQWNAELIDLSAELVAAGSNFTNQVVIRFQAQDNFPTGSDGLALDDIGLYAEVPEINVKIGTTDIVNHSEITGQDIVGAGSNLNFSIENLGNLDLTLTDQNPTNGDYVTVIGTAPNNVSSATVTTQPGATVVNGTPEGFVINVVPIAAGPYSIAVVIMSDDPVENLGTGTDGDLVAGTSTFTSATAAFTAAHVGTTITISGSGSGNDGSYIIETVVSATEVTLSSAPAADESTLNWSHDDIESTYTFRVSGNAVFNLSPVVTVPGTGSNFTNPSSNQFDLVLNPGATIADVLSVSDPEGDSMTVTVVAPGTPLTTLTTEPTTNGTPTAGPFTLDWAGTVDGSNAPGDFDWTITISDGISTDTVITARITVNDVAPTHAIGPDATTGDGLLSTTGYQATLAVGATTGVALAQINDANTGQSMTLGTVTPDGGNPTAAFTITVNGSNQIVATPNAALVPADVGFHTFDVQVGDGTNNINVFVTVGVEQAPSITSTAPTTAIVGVPYTYTVTADGVPAPTFSVSGLPAWLTFDGTATISGIPAAGDVGTTGNITITATNGVTPDDTEVFAITVSANATPTVTVTENGNPVTAGQTLTVATNDPISGLTLVFTGADADAGDTVTLSSVVTNNGNITGFTQSEWDNATGANPVTATPNAGTVDVDGLMQVTVTATDNNGASSNFSFFILLPVAGNTAPAVALTGTSTLTGNQASGFALSINENTALSLADLVITDPDGDNIDVLSVSGTAAGVTAPTTSTGNTSPLTISWTGTPTTAGTYVFDVTITDNNTAPVVFQVTITVNGPKKKKKDGGGGDDGGCAATSTGGSAPFWALLLLTLGGLVAYRRRRNA